LYTDLAPGSDAYPMVNAFSSVDRKYFCEFALTDKTHQNTTIDLVSIDIDSGEMSTQAKSISSTYVDMV